jgi:hypothetical protein
MSSTPVVLKLECDSKDTQTVQIELDIESLLRIHFPRKYIAIIKILDHALIGSDY